jgi:acyl-[acyl-carrier-protein]-phospholipid O-acyltransferase/long-chain-fatty-acid--[acyl-carrier-protein] ligase
MNATTRKNLFWLNLSQALGALNDNVLKLLIVFHLIAERGPGSAGFIAAAGGTAFVLPFLLFSAPAGCVADRYSKSRLIVILKGAEVVIAALAVLALGLGFENGLFAVVFLMATHSAFFTPAKYGVLPELVEQDQLSRANGLVEACTFLAIIAGTALAPFLVQLSGRATWAAGLACVGIALCGLAAALKMQRTEARDASKPVSLFPTEILRTLKTVRRDRHLLLAVLGIAYFMSIGAFAQLNLIAYGMERLGLTETQSGYLFLAAALGIGAGSLLAARLSGRDVEFGIVPLGAAGLAVSLVLLHAGPATLPFCLGAILLFGVSAGLFSLPLQTFIQYRAAPENRGEVLAASSFLSWTGILAASGLTYLFGKVLGLDAAQGFTAVAAATLLLTIAAFRLLPDFLLRFLALALTRTLYRIRVIGGENLPVDGPALIVPNHVTWADAFLLTATNQRRIRFVMDRDLYNTPLLRPLLRFMGVIPVSSKDGKRGIVEFIRLARRALDEGYAVCIFAEGAVTRNGMLGGFRPGFEHIVKGTGYPIVPAYIGGAWGSVLSYAHGPLLSRWPKPERRPITLLFGKPLPSASTAAQVRLAVTELSADYFDALKPGRKSLAETFVRTAKDNWPKRAICDTTGKSLTYGQTLTAAKALSGRLEPRIGEAEHVGILLPPSVGGALANLALSLLGRVPVNLNYTAPESSLRSAVAQCGIGTIVTSRAFLDKFPALAALDGLLILEDVSSAIRPLDKLAAFAKARLFPARFLCRRRRFEADSPATVIFSSGSTGEPKGVVLTHHNILSNVEGLRMVFRTDANDNLCAALPFFHSLGFTGTLWFPLVCGFSASYHANPLEGEKIAQVVREERSTILLATPTFLLTYLRRAKREDFATLRLVVTGAEKLQTRLADAFEEKFGIRPLEGYGATELSPVVSLNLPDVTLDGAKQVGAKEGSVGHPLPGVALRVVDPETHAGLGPGQTGLILVRGPNVMAGYLGLAGKTAEAVRGGWYVTGDLGALDEDGFLRITDRLSRFSKIGGEMVPHGAVEDELQNCAGRPGVLAVTSLPDEKKGERLVVLYEKGAVDAEALHRRLSESSLPNLWKPGRESYLEVESLPVLGTGKLDLQRLRELARSLEGNRCAT